MEMEKNNVFYISPLDINSKMYKWKYKFFYSIKEGKGKTFIQGLLDAGEDINAIKNEDRTVLSYASEYGNLDIITFLVEKGADANNDPYGLKPLHIAAGCGHKKVVEFFLNSGVLINSCDAYMSMPLHHAAQSGLMQIVKLLLRKGAAVDKKNSDNQTPVLLASEYRHKEIVKILLAAGADVHNRSSDEWTLLHFASYNGWLEIAQYLVTVKIELNAKNCSGDTALLLAAEKSHKHIVKLLINAGAIIDNQFSNKWTLLHHAAEKGWIDIAQSLVLKGFDLNAKNSDGDVPLILAARNFRRDIVELLVSLGANVTCYMKNGITLLHYAAGNGWLEVVQYLVQKGANPNVKTSRGCTPLFFAAYGHHKDVLELFIDFGTNVNCCDDKDWTVLHHVSKDGWVEVVELLVQKGADLNPKTSDGKTPLLLAAENSNEVLVKQLINMGANVNSYGEKNWTVLHYASKCGWLDVAQSIVKSEAADLNATTDFDDTPLLVAAKFHNINIVLLLINAGANLECCNKNKLTLLSCALKYGWLEVIQSLANRGVDFNLETISGEIPLLIAAKSYHADCVQFLVEIGVNVDCCDENKWTVLHYASLHRWVDVVKSVVEMGCDVNVKTSSGDSATHLACNLPYPRSTHLMDASIEIVQILIENGADINATTDFDYTPLLIATNSAYYSIDIVLLLINAGANLECCDKHKWTLLCYALDKGWLKVIQALAKRGVDFNLKTPSGQIPLLIAAKSSQRYCVQILIERGVNVDCSLEDKWTVLHYASLHKWPDVVKSVVERGADVNVKTSSGDSAVHLACKFSGAVTEYLIDSSVEVVQILVEKGADINAKNADGNTPLFLVCECRYFIHASFRLKLVNLLFRAGADCNVENKYGERPLNINCLTWINNIDNIELIKLCIRHGAYFYYSIGYYYSISKNSYLKKGVLQDIKLCTQAIINKFNNKDLPTLYKLDMLADILPPIEKIKIADNRGITQDIEQVQAVENTVRWEIQTKGYCNVLEASPMVLSILSVKSFINFYNTG